MDRRGRNNDQLYPAEVRSVWGPDSHLLLADAAEYQLHLKRRLETERAESVMTIVRCPRCGDEVLLPPRAASGALVRCPLCLEEYLLAEALTQVPPALVVISSPAGQSDS